MLIEALACVVWFCIAATSDWLSVAWHDAREKRHARRSAHLAVALEAVTWAPLLLVFETGYWSVIVASLAGSWVGSYVAVRRLPLPEIPEARVHTG